MRSFRQTVALASQRAVNLRNSAGVEDRLIDGDIIRSATCGYAGKNLLHQLSCTGIVRQIHAIEQVCAVATVRHNRIREASTPQVIPCTAGGRNRSAMLPIGRTDTSRAHRIEVDKQPSAAEYVCVRRRDLRIVSEPVCGARQQCRVAGIQREVNARYGSVDRENCVCQSFSIVEVSCNRPAASGLWDADLMDIAG